MWEFKEELKNIGINGKVPSQFLNDDGDCNCVKAIIDWTLDFEMREYGVKDTYIHIIKVTLIFDDFDYGLEEYVLPDTFAISTSWYNRDDFKWLTIFPVELWVDFDDKKVSVDF
tara:strand:- start:51 stop:392 length:342 start_codon:yes stop_codon:yes gene_type:complete